MKTILALLFLFNTALSKAQVIDSLNTAKLCSYMKPEEREMIYEINLLRSNPPNYVQFIQPLLDNALKTLRTNGKGPKNYSLTFSTTTRNGKEIKKIDTTWDYANEEEVKALQSLVKDLKKLKRLSVLQPDSGIYLAVKSFAEDQEKHNWNLIHQGTDGSWPWDRITKFSPKMKSGNENGAGNSANNIPKEFVLQLLIDSGIPGYGHRYNLLNPEWTHVACFGAGRKEGMFRWIQNFGAAK